MEIRRATKTDIDKIYDLLTELTNTFDKKTFDDLFQRELQNSNIYHLVATEDQIIIGYLDGKIEERLTHDRKVATIEALIVSSQHRGQGVGKKLFQAFEKIINEKDCDTVEVCSKLEREGAHHFYTEKCGMKKTSYQLNKHYN